MPRNTNALFPRFHLFEIEDFSWFPAIWRDLMTDYLRFLQEKLGVYDPAIELLRDLRTRGHANTIIDLCSGSGGPLLKIIDKLKQVERPISVTLTDKFPPSTAVLWKKAGTDSNIAYLDQPVDARDVPQALVGFRTLFTAFHHFEPSDALAILKDASSSGIAIFEISERSLLGFLRVTLLCLASPLLVFFIKPFSWTRILWTLIPVVPMLTLWDGLVSHLRSYTIDELQAFLDKSGCAKWGRVGIKQSNLGARMTYLIIEPKQD